MRGDKSRTMTSMSEPHETRCDAAKVSIAIATYRREEVLVETVRQVLHHTQGRCDVVVVDQTPEHELETESALSAWARDGSIRWLKQEAPSLPAARNRALREARGDIVIFIDDDVVLDPGFVSAHVRNYDDPAVVGVAGKVVQAKGWSYPPRLPAQWPTSQDYLYFRLDGGERKVGIANFCGANHSVRRSALLALGGYDENYIGWAYREDTDAALRLWRAGGTLVYDPTASLLHLAAPSGGCRIRDAGTRLPEWKVSFPASYFAVRHQIHSQRGWADLLVRNVRKYVFRRENVLRPWRVPFALGAYVFALSVATVRAVRRAKAGRC